MTLCCIFSSVRGCAYFCTSVQIFIGMYMFLKWIIVPYIKGNQAEYFEDSRPQILYPMAMIYITVFVVLGFMNFLAVQRESGKVVKWVTRALVVLQLLELTVHIILGFGFPDNAHDEVEVHRVFHIQRICINLLGSLIYFTVLFKYCKELYHDIYVIDEEEGKRLKGKKGIKAKKTSIEENVYMKPSAPPTTPSPSVPGPSFEDIMDSSKHKTTSI